MLQCKSCKTEFEPWSPDVARKIAKGHVPLCGNCWYSIYKGLPPPPGGKVGYVEKKAAAGNVPTKGTKKYLCGECKFEQFEPWIIQDRAARIRCPGCGSLDYRPKTKEAKDDMAEKKDVAKAFGDLKGSDGGESFVRG